MYVHPVIVINNDFVTIDVDFVVMLVVVVLFLLLLSSMLVVVVVVIHETWSTMAYLLAKASVSDDVVIPMFYSHHSHWDACQVVACRTCKPKVEQIICR